ncbi:conserved hypothetical protein [Candidatus Brocadia pituitae]|nr:conserved hypothetical protein [Candidatus Brocadia pituitae]
MNAIPKLIHTVQSMGYKVILNGDKIKLKFVGKDNPPKEASTTINEIKGNKATVIEYLKTMNEMEAIFKDTVSEIAQVYREDTFSYIMLVFPRMYDKTQELEQRMNKMWDEGKDIKAFQEIVKQWEEMNKRCIKLYCTKNGIDTIVDDVYNPPNGKPGPNQGLGKEVV